jgi:quercetin dioxygenase-like cupin family protein
VEAAAKHILVRTKSGPAYWTVGCMFRFLVSSVDAGGSYTTMEITVPPGEGANPHSHSAEAEQFYVLDGDLNFEVGGEELSVGAGDFLHIPRGTVRSFKAAEHHARLLATFVPGTGIEQVFIDAGELLSSEDAYSSARPTARPEHPATAPTKAQGPFVSTGPGEPTGV